MKNLIFLLFLVILINGCEEKCAIIPPLQPPTVGEKNVLIEEFTGVRCVNCPEGSAEIENLKVLYKNLIAVSIHAGTFAKPYPNQDDYSIQDGKDILNYLGEPIGYPAAVIDRKVFPDNNGDIQTGRNQWAGYISDESKLTPKVSISISKNYNEANRNLEISTNIIPAENISDKLALTIMITEDSIIGKQLLPSPTGLKEDYVHKHMLRDVVTNSIGDPINEITTKGNVIQKKYSIVLPANLVDKHCHIIAFVSRVGSIKEVLQVEELKLTD